MRILLFALLIVAPSFAAAVVAPCPPSDAPDRSRVDGIAIVDRAQIEGGKRYKVTFPAKLQGRPFSYAMLRIESSGKSILSTDISVQPALQKSPGVVSYIESFDPSLRITVEATYNQAATACFTTSFNVIQRPQHAP